jgi:hypothetical protein
VQSRFPVKPEEAKLLEKSEKTDQQSKKEVNIDQNLSEKKTLKEKVSNVLRVVKSAGQRVEGTQ